MPHSQHDHHHGRDAGLRRLAATLVLVALYMVAEVVGGIYAGSLALLADAGHMLSDAGSLALALFALWIARRPRTPERTFGYHRAEILAALINGVTLVVIAIFIVLEAWQRFQDPQPVRGLVMTVVASGGLVVNLVAMALLHGGRADSLNLRGAWLHVVADTLGSLQAVIAGALIWAYGWTWVDPAASLMIALLVVGSSWTLLRDSVDILMESTPRRLNAAEIRDAMATVDGVVEVRDLHVWTITSGFDSLSAKVECHCRDRDRLLDEIQTLLFKRFDLAHTTIQIHGSSDDRGHGCDEP